MKKYIPSADLIRTIAILGALSIHIVQPVYSRFDFLGGITWWVTDFWNAFSRMSIPLFIMLSGYLLLGRQESVKKGIWRTIHIVSIPLLFCFFFYTPFNL